MQTLLPAEIAMQVHDPLGDSVLAQDEYRIELAPLDRLQNADAVILAVDPEVYRAGWPLILPLLANAKGIVIDVKTKLDRSKKPRDVVLWRP